MKPLFIIGLTNAIPGGDSHRRLLVIPFGRHPHPNGPVQEVNAATAGKLVATLKKAIASGMAGFPLYNGHPDHGDSVPADPNVYGWATDAEVRTDSVAFTCELNPAGISLVRSGKNLFSPHWLARLANAVAYPFEMLSIGLTDRPVIPVAAIANQKTSAAGGQIGEPMRDRLIAMLKKAGVEVPADCSDEDLAGLCEKQFGTMEAIANELNTVQAQVTNLKGENATLTIEVGTHKSKAAEAVFALTNERKVRQGLLLDVALADGRATPASRKQWENEFAEDFDGAVVKLANAKPVIKVASVTDGLAQRGENAKSVTQIVTLVNEERTKSGCDHHTAHLRVKKAHPELFSK